MIFLLWVNETVTTLKIDEKNEETIFRSPTVKECQRRLRAIFLFIYLFILFIYLFYYLFIYLFIF